MECDQCGARRPPSGPCPYCGAPPPGRSSGADWRSRSGKGAAMPPRGRGGSGANWGGRGNSGANWGYEDEDPMAGRPSGRYRRPPDDYEEVDLERALVPSMGMMPGALPAGAPGLPGMPGVPTEQEERLLGIRRPVYIPATQTKRRRVPSWRVVTGILSIMIACVASCGLAAVFGPQLLGGPLCRTACPGYTPATYSFDKVPRTPAATPGTGPNAKFVVSVTTAKGWTAAGQPTGITSFFYVGDTAYVVAQIRNAPSGSHNVCAHWFVNGLDPGLAASSQLCSSTQGHPDLAAKFSLPVEQVGVFTAQIYWDPPASEVYKFAPTADPALVATIYFGVLTPGQPTPPPPTATPVPTATPKVTPTPKGATPTPTL